MSSLNSDDFSFLPCNVASRQACILRRSLSLYSSRAPLPLPSLASRLMLPVFHPAYCSSSKLSLAFSLVRFESMSVPSPLACSRAVILYMESCGRKSCTCMLSTFILTSYAILLRSAFASSLALPCLSRSSMSTVTSLISSSLVCAVSCMGGRAMSLRFRYLRRHDRSAVCTSHVRSAPRSRESVTLVSVPLALAHATVGMAACTCLMARLSALPQVSTSIVRGCSGRGMVPMSGARASSKACMSPCPILACSFRSNVSGLPACRAFHGMPACPVIMLQAVFSSRFLTHSPVVSVSSSHAMFPRSMPCPSFIRSWRMLAAMRVSPSLYRMSSASIAISLMVSSL